jgi:hypothetical protein
MSHSRPHLSVVIPVYKAEHCQGELYLWLKAAQESISPDFEKWQVEDCWADNSLRVVKLVRGLLPKKMIKSFNNMLMGKPILQLFRYGVTLINGYRR